MTAYDLRKHHRRSIRLQGYDYAQAGAYFVTICAQRRECRFGEVVEGEMRLNEEGTIVTECWQWLPLRYPQVQLDEWMIMPNHVHGIVYITDACKGGSRTAPPSPLGHKSLGRLIGAFKTVSTKRLNLFRQTPGVLLWQRNYYEHVIRNDNDLNHIRHYIANNPLKWAEDENHPATIRKNGDCATR